MNKIIRKITKILRKNEIINDIAWIFIRKKMKTESVLLLPHLRNDIEKLIHVQRRFIYQDYSQKMYTVHSKNEQYIKFLNEVRSLLKVADVLDGELIRVGKNNDGGYVMLNDFDNMSIAYSLGIGNDVSWDSYFASLGYDIYMFDHSIDKLPYENEKFHWSKIGISYYESDSMKNLETIISQNNHREERMLLKMDIEGYEWEFLSKLPSSILNCFDQIVCEIHDLLDYNRRTEILSGLQKLNETHQLIHVHANNACQVYFSEYNVFPNNLEVTYVRKEGRRFNLDCRDKYFPTALDQVNVEYLPDIILGFWNDFKELN